MAEEKNGIGKIKIGISRCLLGEKVRYDGGHKLDRYITDTLGRYFEYVPVCPEVEYGLPVPREAMHLVGDPVSPRLVTIKTERDHTEGMQKWAQGRLDELEKQGLSGFIFKSRSPSSGMQGVKVYNSSGMPSHKGVGIFAKAFMERLPLLPAEDDGRLHDPVLRENFVERVFVYWRWQEFVDRGAAIKDLIDFHTDHKLLAMAHSPKQATDLGRLIAGSGGSAGDPRSAYIKALMEGLRLIATAKKNTNVLHHIMGYFKKNLSDDEKLEVLEVIDNYHSGFLPLVVPVVLLNHYVRKYDQPYLKRQCYLNPHPLELMLRNHV
jgi:uncharacterized protein YbgA (DUF1722 family)/uncharacterized protein YbbK (DUF523 family)